MVYGKQSLAITGSPNCERATREEVVSYMEVSYNKLDWDISDICEFAKEN